MTPKYNYNSLIDNAMRGVIKEVLLEVQKYGLIDNHHFFITFNCNHKDVQISPRMKAKYPEELVIVLQYQFEDLTVAENGFGVTLRFGGIKEHVYIPLAAIKTFSDPSVHFVLDFSNEDDLESVVESQEFEKNYSAADKIETDGNIIDISEIIKQRSGGN